MVSPVNGDLPRDDDFREAVADVEPLRGRRRAPLKSPAAAPVPRQRQRDEAAVLAESLAEFEPEDVLETGEALSYLRDGMSRDTLRKLRRGQWAVEDGIDLHGLTRVQAAAALEDFLRRCVTRRLRCVRIVHGKGMGILKAKLGRWLPQREEVLAYCQAPANDGGGGAVLVLLRARKG